MSNTKIFRSLLARGAATAVVACVTAFAAIGADYPAPKEGDWVARDFRFHTGEVMTELRLHYTTLGEPSGQPVLILHGTTGSGIGMLSPNFAGELFGPGQPRDASKYNHPAGLDRPRQIGQAFRWPACQVSPLQLRTARELKRPSDCQIPTQRYLAK